MIHTILTVIAILVFCVVSEIVLSRIETDRRRTNELLAEIAEHLRESADRLQAIRSKRRL